jgi:hypothetical protein
MKLGIHSRGELASALLITNAASSSETRIRGRGSNDWGPGE